MFRKYDPTMQVTIANWGHMLDGEIVCGPKDTGGDDWFMNGLLVVW